MCLAIPMKVVEKNEDMGRAELSGVLREVSFVLVPEVKVGDYVIVHAGYAIQQLDEKEAQETLGYFEQMGLEDIE